MERKLHSHLCKILSAIDPLAQPKGGSLGPGSPQTGLSKVGHDGKDKGHSRLHPVRMQVVEELLAAWQLLQHSHSQICIDSGRDDNRQQDCPVAHPFREERNEKEGCGPADANTWKFCLPTIEGVADMS